MKHILNNLSNEEKNSIREQHTGGMKVMTENFSRLMNAKLGDAKPLVNEQSVFPAFDLLTGEPRKPPVPKPPVPKPPLSPKETYPNPNSELVAGVDFNGQKNILFKDVSWMGNGLNFLMKISKEGSNTWKTGKYKCGQSFFTAFDNNGKEFKVTLTKTGVNKFSKYCSSKPKLY